MQMPSVSFIFDVEGTLIDCVPQILQSWAEALAEWDIVVEPAALAPFSGMDPNDMLVRVAPRLDREARQEAIDHQGKIYRASFMHRVRAFPRATQVLYMLHGRGHWLALATTCNARELAHYRTLIDAEDVLAVFVCGDDVKHGKPDPALLRVALGKLGTPSAVAVGDTPYDAMAAKSSDMKCLGLLTGGFSAQTLSDAGCDAVYPDLASLGADHSARAAATSY